MLVKLRIIWELKNKFNIFYILSSCNFFFGCHFVKSVLNNNLITKCYLWENRDVYFQCESQKSGKHKNKYCINIVAKYDDIWRVDIYCRCQYMVICEYRFNIFEILNQSLILFVMFKVFFILTLQFRLNKYCYVEYGGENRQISILFLSILQK